MVSDPSVYRSVGSSSLNPCFNGRWSRTTSIPASGVVAVLILVLMEDGLGLSTRISDTAKYNVLILVLMEDGLGPISTKLLK